MNSDNVKWKIYLDIVQKIRLIYLLKLPISFFSKNSSHNCFKFISQKRAKIILSIIKIWKVNSLPITIGRGIFFLYNISKKNREEKAFHPIPCSQK